MSDARCFDLDGEAAGVEQKCGQAKHALRRREVLLRADDVHGAFVTCNTGEQLRRKTSLPRHSERVCKAGIAVIYLKSKGLLRLRICNYRTEPEVSRIALI